VAVADDAVRLVVGLGNPGAGHADDRHNAGFWLLDRLAERLGAVFKHEARFKADTARPAGGLHLLKPTTYMNLSGEAVAAYAHFYRLQPAAILIVHDELDLAAGSVRLKRGGGHGGHNGLRSIEGLLGSNAFLRVRLGVGHPGTARDVTAHVLSKPSVDDRQAIATAIDSVLEHFDGITQGGFELAMNTLNRRATAAED